MDKKKQFWNAVGKKNVFIGNSTLVHQVFLLLAYELNIVDSGGQ